jgi:hypothetical protein
VAAGEERIRAYPRDAGMSDEDISGRLAEARAGLGPARFTAAPHNADGSPFWLSCEGETFTLAGPRHAARDRGAARIARPRCRSA